MRLFSRNSLQGIFLLGISIYALVAPKLLSNFTLCIGRDGHVEFENRTAACCNKTVAHSDHFQYQVSNHFSQSNHLLFSGGDCGACMDVYLGAEDVDFACFRPMEEWSQVFFLSSPATFASHQPQILTGSNSSRPQTNMNFAIASLRSVVILV